jgi:uncharacterized NAD-dependent epimerase/dehydratase family protein
MVDLVLPQPYFLFLGDIQIAAFAKTALGLRDWAGDRCVGEFALPAATVSTGLPRFTLTQARALGARSVVIGAATPGGAIPDAWLPPLIEALESEFDLISGMHTRLEKIPALAATAQRLGRRLINVRQPPTGLPVGSGRKRTGRRLLAVGSDCAVGKKYTALTLASEFKKRGLSADFRATGQTGILIAGGGIPMDAVVSDFLAGAAETLTPDALPDHWDVVEGQGSLFHPSYAGVSLGLLHGTQPDVIVMCHEVGRDKIIGVQGYATPDITEAIAMNITLGRRTNPQIFCAGVSLNTAKLTAAEALRVLAQESARLGLPVADPMRPGAELERLVDACLA